MEKLNGVGPVIAKRIVEGRPYYKPMDLLKVKGIGDVRLSNIKGNIEF